MLKDIWHSHNTAAAAAADGCWLAGPCHQLAGTLCGHGRPHPGTSGGAAADCQGACTGRCVGAGGGGGEGICIRNKWHR
jgi:hypothetical protein